MVETDGAEDDGWGGGGEEGDRVGEEKEEIGVGSVVAARLQRTKTKRGQNCHPGKEENGEEE